MNIYIHCRELLLARSTNPFVQFVKYGIFGVLSASTGAAILAALYLLYPTFVAESLPDSQRAFNVNVFNTIAFIPSNLVAYFTNRAFVFTPGRYHGGREFLLFMVIASASYLCGLFASNYAVEGYDAPSWAGTVAFMMFSALINFISRKFLIFKH